MTEKAMRAAVWSRAGNRCEYCLMPQACDPIPFELDHIIAHKHRGPTELENLAVACFPCNNHKGPNLAGIDPQTRQMARLFHPRLDAWLEHFRLGSDGVLLGITGIGRATGEVLELNLGLRVAHRVALLEEGLLHATPVAPGD